MGIQVHPCMLLQDLSVTELLSDIFFMRDYYNLVDDIRIHDRRGLVYSLGEPDAASFHEMVHRAAVVVPETALVPGMFSDEFQAMDIEYGGIGIREKRQYLAARVEVFLSVMRVGVKSDTLNMVMRLWTTTSLKDVRGMWRAELRSRI